MNLFESAKLSLKTCIFILLTVFFVAADAWGREIFVTHKVEIKKGML